MLRPDLQLPAGLRGRLLLAFGGIGALAALGAAAGLAGLIMLRDALDDAPARADTTALELSEHAGRLIAVGPVLLNATDADEVSSLMASLHAEATLARRQLSAVQSAGSEAALLSAAVALLTHATANADAIAAAVLRRNEAASARTALLHQALIASQQSATLLVPEFQTMPRQAVGGRQNGAIQTQGFAPLQQLQRIFADISRLLLTATTTEGGQKLGDQKATIEADLQGIDALVSQLHPSTRAALSPPIERLRRFTLGSGGLFATMRSELAAVAAARGLIADNAGLANQLSNSIKNLVAIKGLNNAGLRRAIAAQYIATALLAVVAATSLIVWLPVSRKIVSRLVRLSSAMSAIAAGRLDVAADDSGDDEIGMMSRAVAVFRGHAIELAALRTPRSVTAQRPGRPADGGDRTVRSGPDEAALAVMFDTLDQGVAIFDRNLDLVAWNRAFCELMRLPDSFLQSRPNFDDFVRLLTWRGEFGPGSVERRIGASRAAIDRPMLAERARPDGTTILVRRTPCPGGGFVSIYTDITERKRAKAEIGSARRDIEAAVCRLTATQARLVHGERMAALGYLIARVAADIEGPLNFVNNLISVTIELLGELKATTGAAAALLTAGQREKIEEIIARLRDILVRIMQHGKDADDIIKSTLAYSRASRGERQSVDLNALVEEAMDLAYNDARLQDENCNITLERDFDPGIAPIEVVPQALSRAFVNLFRNGLYAAAKDCGGVMVRQSDPALKVTTRDRIDDIEIRVRDNGGGMPLDVRDKLFRPFFTTKPIGEGAGLGLSISYDIVVHEHGGSIVVDSQPGVFTEFSIRIPYHRAAAARETAA